MDFIRNHWFHLGLILFAFLAFYGIREWASFSTVECLLLASLMALPLHQFEEYALPGGGPLVINKVFWREKKDFMNYPGNWNSIMIVNLSAYIFYAAAFLLPHAYWLGLAVILFNLFQVLGHGLEMNIKGRTWYNPGMATSILLFLPVSAIYIWEIQDFLSVHTVILSLAAVLVIVIATVILPVQGLKNRNSPYRIPEWQYRQFEKVRRKCSLPFQKP